MDCKKGREYGMSIVTMKRFRMVGLTAEQDALLQALLHIGCVEISQPDQKLTDPEWAGLLRPGSTTVQISGRTPTVYGMRCLLWINTPL